jgi:hypothetical protein
MPSGEAWTRDFGGRRFRSIVSAGEGRHEHLLEERFGPFKFGLALVLENERLHFVVRNWRVFGLPIFKRWAPFGDSYEHEQAGTFCFHIEIRHPLLGLLVKYSGGLA